MRNFILIIIVICFIFVNYAANLKNDIETISNPVMTQRYVGRFREEVSFYRDFKDRMIIQKEQAESFDIYSLDLNSPIIKFEYSIKTQNKLLYSKQLDKERTLKVKQLDNGEESNLLVLEGKTTRNIAKNIAYSQSALVSASPSQKYVLYCAANEILNRYSLYLYDLETDQTLQLIDTVNEELLNDMEWNIAWSPNETFIVVANKLILSVNSGKLINEINAENILWSSAGNKLAYIKSEKGCGKSICIFDLNTEESEEVFIVSQGEYLPGYLVWNENETKLAFVTAFIEAAELENGISPYVGIYSLDLMRKEAIRVDATLKLDPLVVKKLVNLQYNATGNLIALTIANESGCDIYFYDIKNETSKLALDVEYLHYEDNESYVCSSGSCMYYVQGQSVFELDERLNNRQIYQTENVMEDIYISKNGNSMIVIEKSINGILFRQIANFTDKSM